MTKDHREAYFCTITRMHRVSAALESRDGETEVWALGWSKIDGALMEGHSITVRVLQAAGQEPSLLRQEFQCPVPVDVLAAFCSILPEERRARCSERR